MARFVAYGANYSHGVRSEVIEPLATGTRVLVRGLEAQFETRGVTDYEKELAGKTLQINGLPEDRIEGGHISPASRISAFDSEKMQKHWGWTDEEHDLVVKTLRESDQNGLRFMEIVAPKRPAPWNGYDELDDVERILTAVDLTGVDPAEVLAYERENANREEVVAALEDLAGDGEEESVVIEA